MKVAVLSDIHSNLEALEAVTGDARDWGASSFLVAGDIVGYGACPDRCIKVLEKIKAICIAGNHDWAVLDKTPISYFNSAARQAVLWTKDRISDESRDFLEQLPLTLKWEQISMAHANFVEPGGWGYVFTIYEARRQYERFDTVMGVIGHSHVPFVVSIEENSHIHQELAKTVKPVKHKRYLANAGSVGQPRDGDPRACYLRVDLDEPVFSLTRVEYDIKSAQRRIEAAGLPAYLARRLLHGR